MDTPVMDMDVVLQQLFSDVNISSAYYDTISPELTGEMGFVRVTKEGKVIQVSLPEELRITRGNAGTKLQNQKHNFSDFVVQNRILDAIRSVSNNAEEYEGLKQGLIWKLSDEGRESQLKEYRNQYDCNVKPEHKKMMDKVMTRLQRAIAKNDISVLIKPYEYFVSNDSSLNAFSTFNRTIVAYSGLFEKLNENEIAAVLAHELGHGQGKHTELGIMKRAGIILGMGMLGMKNDAGFVNIVVHNMERQGISMGQEREADAFAFQCLVDAGYNPGALAALYQRYYDLGVTGNSSDNILIKTSFPIDHPLSLDRRNNAIKKLYEYSNGHVFMDNERIFVDGEELCKVGKEDDNSGMERACLVLGNLAQAYHNGKPGMTAYAKDNIVMFGSYEIMVCGKHDKSAEKIASRLNEIHSQNLNTLLEEEGTTLFQTGQSLPKRVFGKEGKSIASIGNTQAVNRFSYMKQFNMQGKEVSSKFILDGETQQKVIVEFSEKSWDIFQKIMHINIYEPNKEEVGRKAGRFISELLQDKNSVEFFKLMQRNADYISENANTGIVQFIPAMKKVFSGKYKGSASDYEMYKQSVDIVTSLLGVTSPQKDFKTNPLIRMGDNFTWSSLGIVENTVTKEGFESLCQNPDFRNGMMEEFRKNTEAMKNLEEIHTLEKEILGNVEALRTNTFDVNVKINSVVLDKMEGEMKLVRRFMRKYKVKDIYNNKDSANESIKKIMEAYFENVFLLERNLQKNKLVFDNLIKTYPTAESLTQQKEIEVNLVRVKNMRKELCGDKEWGSIAQKVISEREKQHGSLQLDGNKNVVSNVSIQSKNKTSKSLQKVKKGGNVVEKFDFGR